VYVLVVWGVGVFVGGGLFNRKKMGGDAGIWVTCLDVFYGVLGLVFLIAD